MQALAEAIGDVCDTVDPAAKGSHHADLDQRANRSYWLEQAVDRRIDYMHSGFGCSTYSAPLSLPSQDATGATVPPMGPYRSQEWPDGLATLPAVIKRRCESADHHRTLTLYMGRALTAHNRPVIIENAADCSLPSSPGYMELGGYSTATQFSAWAHPDTRAYITDTGSVLVTKPLYWTGSPYRNLKTFCLNPAAYRHAAELLALPDDWPRAGLTRMRGWAADGRSHGQIAQEYTPECSGILHRILTAAAREALHGPLQAPPPPLPPSSGAGGSSRPPQPPPPPPPPPSPSAAAPQLPPALPAGQHRAAKHSDRRVGTAPSDLKVC